MTLVVYPAGMVTDCGDGVVKPLTSPKLTVWTPAGSWIEIEPLPDSVPSTNIGPLTGVVVTVRVPRAGVSEKAADEMIVALTVAVVLLARNPDMLTVTM